MMSYDKTAVMGGKEIWREETVRVDSGGYNLDMTGLKEGDVVEKGTPLIVDFDKRTAKVAKGADEAKTNRLLYASVKAEKNEPVTVVNAADEVRDDLIPLSAEVVKALSATGRFLFLKNPSSGASAGA